MTIAEDDHANGKRITVLDAPSNLGLRPPADDCVPGVYKLAGALRDTGLLERLGAADGGVVVPPRYRMRPEETGIRNQSALVRYTAKLAARVDRLIGAGNFPLLLGGDCSIVLGPALALRRRGRFGLVFIDGHSDFRHPGNSNAVGAAAGEDLALATGRGAPALVDIDGQAPYVADADVVLMGVRDHDEDLDEVAAAGAAVFPSSAVAELGGAETARRAIERLRRTGVDGYWIHVDADVVDALILPAVDSPEPGGITLEQARDALARLVADEAAAGMDVTILDPDLDEEGEQVAALADVLVDALRPARQTARLHV
jgi:arginase